MVYTKICQRFQGNQQNTQVNIIDEDIGLPTSEVVDQYALICIWWHAGLIYYIFRYTSLIAGVIYFHL